MEEGRKMIEERRGKKEEVNVVGGRSFLESPFFLISFFSSFIPRPAALIYHLLNINQRPSSLVPRPSFL
jgi:hypothetical protein